ncbi:F-box protein 15 [Rhinolophus ferrumequinum]|uniref:F-box protein 15 n=1 Tax=Rhinolophus ferrumequinum TaxID=59479 RepID=A0A7J7TQV2_RHIFE|nr:F-box only protein 15 isoform X4 [Rhinolophus ferrumequinum]KAF6302865.1 F-box protein 15 [Rhinolophus ferrumequinum]
MATGRGRLLLQHWLGLQALRLPLGGVGAAPGSGGFRKGAGVEFAAGWTMLKQYARCGRKCEGPSAACSVSLDGMPPEILLKILSYLDAVTLLCAGCVNRRFYHLANDKISGLGWVIILKEKSGREYVMDHVELSVNDSSVTIVWYGKNWPRLATLSTLNLCGVTPVFMDRSKIPTKNGPRWHSLIAKYSLSHFPESTMIGCDRLIRIFHLNPGLLVGLWKREEELAFVTANLHLHHLAERSTLGSAALPYELPPHTPRLDDTPEYGLHGYQLHVDMHSGGIFYLCSTFRNLFTKKGHIENGYAKLIVIHFKNNTEHLPLVGKVGLSWRTDVFDGCIKSCSIMDMTLLDEYGQPFWCFSSPVCMRSSPRPSDGPHFWGQTYHVDYADASGRLHMELVWITETEEHFIVSLVLYLSVAKINHWFGTQY